MPATSDILQFLRGQIFQTPTLPKVTFVGKTVIVTGGNSGLGFECAKQLIHLNVSTLILGCRSVSKGEAAKEKIVQETGGGDTSVEVWKVDMANYASVKLFSERVSKKLDRLDAIVVNAGISTNEYQVAEDLEQTLTVNVVSAFLLSFLCLPLLKHTTAQYGSPTHLTFTGSLVHCFADQKQIQHPPLGQVFRTLSDKDQADMGARYFLSKLILLLCIQEMAKHIPKTEKSGSPSVIVNCPNPGWCKTELFRQDDGGVFARNLLKLIGRTSEIGARTLTSAIAAGEETHGRYLSECQTKPSSVWVRSQEGQEAQKRMWIELLDTLDRVSPGVGNILV
ncbi:NAD(P)-binding protein [Polychaeton citri CBS 116435]|uniref:NAD(P)-binding protein n=1 Tax=Polychaeton citri CBS 116435 TaxID=1314669 RepID=A0A9P4UMH5_9PEZI|nr:NAD(P)-binding protein [Polychaeton citri CBS 116435]